MATSQTAHRKVAEWLRSSEFVIIGAGAGMSVEAGIDYNETKEFAKRHPAMVRKGFTHCYQFLGPVDWKSDEEKWGYLGMHLHHCLNVPVHEPSYGALKKATAGKDTFVVTSNVDGLFEKTGYDPAQIYTPQGDFRLLQCFNKCKPDSVWSSLPTVKAVADSIDHESGLIAPAAVPKCPNCGGDAFMNVRGGSWYIETPYEAGERAFQAYVDRVKAALDKADAAAAAAGEAPSEAAKVTIFDIGSGFNTPSVVRFRMERLAHFLGPRAKLVRINFDYPNFHIKTFINDAKMSRCVGISGGVSDALAGITKELEAAHEASRDEKK